MLTACDANCGPDQQETTLEVNIRVRAITQVPPIFEDDLQWNATFIGKNTDNVNIESTKL